MDKHKWQEVPVPDNLKDTFKRLDICNRGDCKCERLTSKFNIFQYIRDKQFYNFVPRCYGDTPLNKQGIDD